MLKQLIEISNRYKIIRGMASYAVLWPCGSLIEQTLIERRNFDTYDWKKCIRFGLFGGFFIGPTLYIWMRLASAMWPKTDVRSSLCKAITEQLSYDPMAITAFLFGMTLIEGKSQKEAGHELRSKFFETYRVGVIYWPCVQTFNFTLIPAKNQVVFTSFFSMLWTSFLAYMKFLELPDVDLDHHAVDIHLLEF